MSSLYVFKNRIYFTGKIKDLKFFLAEQMKKHLTVKELINFNLH
ncbi:hypothetical protein Dtox_2048 [Desulfofarcimen acetoxidans DSM 771]|jgi:hypothetical protein|uniref:Uncharacterized protein n=1 Tax=Desulfofarcimen acetoxidans (strain ATCC 49208 / DSM 771 / KCTC 5769 / VKM B-1644 / 5575) TaxID=485916 RepID=C8VYW7_DESAS|nr:hypothetical protein [Desulfofarcimen acetoxidans]ACV62877.1 hypothetical protein Dtox_2048 [Desulfofarcimen acetoxidans DSM 771]